MIHKEKGFTLVEIMIVVSIIGILAALAIPNLFRARVNSNENVIRTDLRAFSSANESFRAVQTPPSYASTVTALTGASPAYIDQTWASSSRHGFNITYTVATAPAETFSLLAGPVSGSGQVNTYCVDQSGVIVAGASGVSGAAAGCAGGTPISS